MKKLIMKNNTAKSDLRHCTLYAHDLHRNVVHGFLQKFGTKEDPVLKAFFDSPASIPLKHGIVYAMFIQKVLIQYRDDGPVQHIATTTCRTGIEARNILRESDKIIRHVSEQYMIHIKNIRRSRKKLVWSF